MGFGRPDCNVCRGSGFVRPRGGAQYECRSCIGVTDSEWRERQERSARAQATRQEPSQSRPMAASLTEEELRELERIVADWAPSIETLTDGTEDYCGTAARGPARFTPGDTGADRDAALRDLKLLEAIPALLASARKLAAISKIIDRGGAYATRLDLMMALRGALEHGGFPCCGGSDEHPPEHTQDCETLALAATAEPTAGEER